MFRFRNRGVAVTVLTALIITGCGKSGSGDAKNTSASNEVAAESAASQSGSSDVGPLAGAAAASSEAGGAGEATGASGNRKNEIITIGDDSAKLKIGMVADVNGLEDHSFNQSAWEGLQSLHNDIGARVSCIEAGEDKDYRADLELLAEAGNQVCWGVGYQFGEPVQEAAAAYPDTHFAVVDYEYEEVPSNVTSAVFRSEESSYLVGYIAAAVSKSHKVGFIGGMDVDVIHPFQYGFMAGARRADEDRGTSTEVVVNYISSFEDKALGKTEAGKMYDLGCDVIFHAAGGAGVGVIEAAEEKNSFVIGVDCDQAYLSPDHVLTSALKEVDVAVSNISVQYNMGDNIGGRTLEYGLAEHAVGIPAEHPNYSDEIYNEVKELEEQIIFGSIQVPDNEEDFKAAE